jgi:hypothetical protein
MNRPKPKIRLACILIQEIPCTQCGVIHTPQDDQDGLIVWIEDADYNTTGNKSPYCRDCLERARLEKAE